jgi:hypothetical protein
MIGRKFKQQHIIAQGEDVAELVAYPPMVPKVRDSSLGTY